MQLEFFREQMDSIVQQNALDDFVLPDYEKLNVKNISSIIGKVYGINSLASTSFPENYVDDLAGIEKVMLLILDGFGYKRLLDYMSGHYGTFTAIAQKGVLKPITTVFPSTTSTVLTSIFTGLTPAEHSIIGYQMFSKEYGLVFNTLGMNPVYGYSRQIGLAEEYARKINPWLQKLKENGIAPYITTKGSIAGDGLSRVIHKDQELLPYRLHSDMLVHCTRVLEQQNNAFLMAYYSGIDNLAHAYGPYSQEVDFEINSIECNLKNFFNLLTLETKRKTLLLILADHGVVETGRIYYLKDYPEIGSRLMLPPVGDSRATFLFTKPDQKNTLPEVFRKNVEKINLYESAELYVKGAFGNVANRETLRYSVGDFTALSVEKNILQYPYFEEDRFHEQLGAHGGMTAEEIIVPLLSIRLSKL